LACVILFVLVVEGSLNWNHFQVQKQVEQTKRSTFGKRDACPVINVSCGKTGATCGVPDGSEPCFECVSNASLCLFQAASDTDKCKCYTDGIACINSFKQAVCSFYAYAMYQQFSAQGLTCLGVAPSEDFTYCEIGSNCNNGTCKLVTTNGDCKTSADCGDSNDPYIFSGGNIWTCNTQTKKCELQTDYASIGDPCTADANCINNPTVTCKGGICVGLAKDASCSGSDQCDAAFFCDPTALKCVPRVATGAACPVELWGKQEPCASPINLCSAGTCTKVFSKKVGATCNTSTECEITLVCDQTTGTCSNPYPDRACNTTSDCPNNGMYLPFCQCQGLNSKTTTCEKTDTPMIETASCFSSVIPPLEACLEKNNCQLSFIPGSCARTKCTNEANCYFNCGISGVLSSTCAVKPATCSSSSSGSGSGSTTGSAVSVGVCLWLAVLAIVFAMF